MKISTKIYESSSGCKWNWKLKVISCGKYNIDEIFKTSCNYFGLDNLLIGYTDTYEEAEHEIRSILMTIKHNIVKYKYERTQEKFWQWDDVNNEFKRSNV